MRALIATLGIAAGIALTLTTQRTWRQVIAELLSRGDA